MLRRQILAVALAAAMVATGCGDALGPEVRTARISAARESNGIRLTNLTDDWLAYFMIDTQALILVDWSPCATQEPECLRIPPQSSILAPFTDVVGGGSHSAEIGIYNWWVKDNGDGTFTVDMDEPVVLKK